MFSETPLFNIHFPWIRAQISPDCTEQEPSTSDNLPFNIIHFRYSDPKPKYSQITQDPALEVIAMPVSLRIAISETRNTYGRAA